ncbi:MAG TPA: molybdopterin cofactor-binding domain-containing protein [Burkholderiales bacterium]|nr:molybdopterin cofactor-binding domain-containing protein [Burkholderiales bacterium]
MPAEKRVRFEADGTVSVMVGKVELGQGIVTALAQIAAEELGVPLEKIRMLPASTAYSPDEGVTSGSLSIQEGGKALRLACAEAREERKPESGARVVGTSVPRLDLPGKFAGRPSYIQDMVLSGMLHGRVVRPPHGFLRLKSFLEPPGVSVVRDGSFLGVLADKEEQAIAAAAKLRAKCEWEPSAPVPADIHAWLKAHAAELYVSKELADSAARARGIKRVQAAYTKPYIAHASIGPSCALARWQGKRLEIWTHSQGIFNLRRDLALVLRMPAEDIVVTHAEGAGCYGHNGADDVALDAALLARAAGGRPVRVQWMREDEFAWEPYGAAMAFEMEAQLGADGRIASWRHSFWSNGHTHRPGRADKPTLTAAAHLDQPFELSPAVNPPLPSGGADRNAIPGYDFPDLLVVNHYVKEMPLRSSSLRSLGAYGNVFAIESFMDECAAAASIDPILYRLSHLKDPRGRAVLETLLPEWRSWKRLEGRGHGIGYAKYKNLGAYCAVLAEVEATHELRVTRLVAAVDVGIAVNPDGVVNQIEGGCIQAASWTLKEAWKPGVAGWEDYPILKFSEVPPVSVLLLESDQPSVGAGECTMGPTAAAIANALHDALGVRVRDLPLTPERIAQAINT